MPEADSIDRLVYRNSLDSVLSKVADPFAKLPDELRLAARRKISDRKIGITLTEEWNYAIIQRLKANDPDGLMEHLSSTDARSIDYRTLDVFKELLADPKQYSDGVAAFNLVYKTVYEHFATRHTDLDHLELDDFIPYGHKTGEVVGITGHDKAIADLFEHSTDRSLMVRTAIGIASGLGATNDIPRFEQLLTEMGLRGYDMPWHRTEALYKAFTAARQRKSDAS